MTTLMTVLGTGLVVWASVLCFGLTDGLQYALRVSGDPLDLIVLRKGSTDETGSGIEQKVARQIMSLPGIAKDESDKPLCSVEFVTILTKPRRNNGGTVNLIVRGLVVGIFQTQTGRRFCDWNTGVVLDQHLSPQFPPLFRGFGRIS